MTAGPAPTPQRESAPVPAGPRGTRLLGSMSSYNADPLAFMTDTARRYGDFVPLRFGPIRAVLLSDPRDIESVLVEHPKSFHKSRGTHRLATLLGNGIFLSEGDYWLRHRRLMQPAFHRAAVERYGEIMMRRISEALERWASLDTLDVVRETRRLALEIATETLFGNDVSEQEAQAIGSAIEVAAAQLQTRVSSLKMYVPDWVPSAGNRRMNAAIDEIDRLVYRIINDRRGRSGERDDLLALLLAESDREGGGMTDRELRDEVVTLLVAGHETTALTLAWAMYEIAGHPEVGDALRTEVDEVLGGRPATATDIHRLPVAASVVSETLRLYPAAYLTARQAIEDVEIGGRPIKRRTLVLLCQWEQHRDQATFEDPAVFRPDRWRDGLLKELDRGAYFPFGLGPRMCIGMSFANLELMLALPMIHQRYRFELTSTDEPRPVPIVALNPDRPIRLRMVPL